MNNDFKYQRKRKLLGIISVIVILVLAVLLTVFFSTWLSSFSEDGLKEYIRSFGVWSWLVMFALQFIQVFIALIPGEFIETAAGYVFGAVGGTLICYAGVTAASALVFLLTKKFGIALVEIFVPREKISELKFINTKKKRNLLVFWLFFIPGTPKDLLTYFVGLTDMKLSEFLIITLVARIPSVLSSTFGGQLLGNENYWSAAIVYVVIGVISLIGLTVYNRILSKNNSKSNEEN